MKIRLITVFSVVALVLSFPAELFGGSPEQDAATRHLRESFSSARNPGFESFPLGEALRCFSRSAVLDDFRITYGEIYPLEVLGGVLRVRYFMATNNDNEQDGIIVPTQIGMTLDTQYVELVLRVLPSGELVAETTVPTSYGIEKAGRAVSNPGRLALYYSVCKLKE
ncbi:MAG: hypothetical protein NDJ89_13195 [Oligoflexia bacterium]|nr:hypothetical protein [Oligoflexia bacterium]